MHLAMFMLTITIIAIVEEGTFMQRADRYIKSTYLKKINCIFIP